MRDLILMFLEKCIGWACDKNHVYFLSIGKIKDPSKREESIDALRIEFLVQTMRDINKKRAIEELGESLNRLFTAVNEEINKSENATAQA